jgi:hypothetical protein
MVKANRRFPVRVHTGYFSQRFHAIGPELVLTRVEEEAGVKAGIPAVRSPQRVLAGGRPVDRDRAVPSVGRHLPTRRENR